MSGLKELLGELIQNAIAGFDTNVEKAVEVLTQGGSDSVWDSMTAISDSLKPFCYVIVSICMMIEIAQVLQKADVLKWEQALKLGVKLVFAKLCIDNAPTFLKACYNQANIWMTEAMAAGNYVTLSSVIGSHAEDALAGVTGLWSVLGLFVSTLLVALAIKVCGMLIQVIALIRLFEIYAYLAVSPFPCAFFPLGDGSGGSWSQVTKTFLKSFIAVCLQGVLIVLCIKVFYNIVGSNLMELVSAANAGTSASAKVTELCFSMLLGAVVLVIAVLKSGSLAKTLISAM